MECELENAHLHQLRSRDAADPMSDRRVEVAFVHQRSERPLVSPEGFEHVLCEVTGSPGGFDLLRARLLQQLRIAGSPADQVIIPGAALLAAFAALTFRELPKSPTHVIAVIVSAVVMSICLLLAKTLKQNWLKERGMGISLLIGLVAAYFAHYAGLAMTEA